MGRACTDACTRGVKLIKQSSKRMPKPPSIEHAPQGAFRPNEQEHI